MTKPMTVEKLLYTPVEAAHALGVSRSTIYILMAKGDVPSVQIGASRRTPAEALRRYVEQLSAGLDEGKQQNTNRRGPKQQPLRD